MPVAVPDGIATGNSLQKASAPKAARTQRATCHRHLSVSAAIAKHLGRIRLNTAATEWKNRRRCARQEFVERRMLPMHGHLRSIDCCPDVRVCRTAHWQDERPGSPFGWGIERLEPSTLP